MKAEPACFRLLQVFWSLTPQGTNAQHPQPWGDGARQQKLSGFRGGPMAATPGLPVLCPRNLFRDFYHRVGLDDNQAHQWEHWLRPLHPSCPWIPGLLPRGDSLACPCSAILQLTVRRRCRQTQDLASSPGRTRAGSMDPPPTAEGLGCSWRWSGAPTVSGRQGPGCIQRFQGLG